MGQARLPARDVLAGFVIVAFLVPNVAAIIRPYEEFPYTSAPMFAHYVDRETTARYGLRFIAEWGDGRPPAQITPRQLGVAGVPFSRYFFSHVYGSTDPGTAFGYRNDTPAAFARRNQNFFQRAVRVLQGRDAALWRALSRIRLEAFRLGPDGRDVDVHVVGHYDVASGEFTHSWGRRP